jgi:hypothetical protein
MTIKMIIVFSRGTGESLFKLNFPHAGTGRCSFSQVRIGRNWIWTLVFHRWEIIPGIYSKSFDLSRK